MNTQHRSFFEKVCLQRRAEGLEDSAVGDHLSCSVQGPGFDPQHWKKPGKRREGEQRKWRSLEEAGKGVLSIGETQEWLNGNGKEKVKKETCDDYPIC